MSGMNIITILLTSDLIPIASSTHEIKSITNTASIASLLSSSVTLSILLVSSALSLFAEAIFSEVLFTISFLPQKTPRKIPRKVIGNVNSNKVAYPGIK